MVLAERQAQAREKAPEKIGHFLNSLPSGSVEGSEITWHIVLRAKQVKELFSVLLCHLMIPERKAQNG